MKKEVYFDHAATTYLDSRVLEVMLPYFGEKYGNASSSHTKGKEALVAIDDAKEIFAKTLNCKASEIIFTGSATEANNLAIFGIAKATPQKNHIIISSIEHSSIYEPCKELEQNGYKITKLPVDKNGIVSPEDLEKEISPQTAVVSIIHGHHEIGTIQPISELGKICKKHNVPFHTDACQTACSHTLDTKKLNIDLMTINGSKIYGPKGIGALYVNKSIQIKPLILGGQQEEGLRAGTENTANIVGFAKALELAQKEKESENKRLTKLRDKLIHQLLKNIPGSYLNGHPEKRLPNNINITIPGINTQELILYLDEAGIFVSSGASCEIGTAKPSPALIAIKIPKKDLFSAIRITLGKRTTEEEIDYAIEKFIFIFKHLFAQKGKTHFR
jgi:cysteine desulfurase